jgi:hypothetical protein
MAEPAHSPEAKGELLRRDEVRLWSLGMQGTNNHKWILSQRQQQFPASFTLLMTVAGCADLKVASLGSNFRSAPNPNSTTNQN